MPIKGKKYGSDTGTVTFQVIIFDDGTIDVYYDDVSTANFLDAATIEIENADATDGAQVAFNTPYIKYDLALRFIAPDVPLTPFITNVSPLTGVVGAGASRDLTVTLDATTLPEGVFYDELMVSSNSPDISRSTSLIELTVVEGAKVTGFRMESKAPFALGGDSNGNFRATGIPLGINTLTRPQAIQEDRDKEVLLRP